MTRTTDGEGRTPSDEVREAFARFRYNLAFTAPELIEMRVADLEAVVLDIVSAPARTSSED